jgi:hypothetical protein
MDLFCGCTARPRSSIVHTLKNHTCISTRRPNVHDACPCIAKSAGTAGCNSKRARADEEPNQWAAVIRSDSIDVDDAGIVERHKMQPTLGSVLVCMVLVGRSLRNPAHASISAHSTQEMYVQHHPTGRTLRHQRCSNIASHVDGTPSLLHTHTHVSQKIDKQQE